MEKYLGMEKCQDMDEYQDIGGGDEIRPLIDPSEQDQSCPPLLILFRNDSHATRFCGRDFLTFEHH